MNILILSSAPNVFATQSLVNAANKRGHSAMVVDPGKISTYISNIESGYDRIYFTDKDSVRRINVKDILITLLSHLNLSPQNILTHRNFEKLQEWAILSIKRKKP